MIKTRRLQRLGRTYKTLLRAHDDSVTRFLETGDDSCIIPFAERFAGLYSANTDAHMLGVHYLNDQGEQLSGEFSTERQVIAEDIMARQARINAKRGDSEPTT